MSGQRVSLEILAELPHPDRFSLGHEGVDWSPLKKFPGRTEGVR